MVVMVTIIFVVGFVAYKLSLSHSPYINMTLRLVKVQHSILLAGCQEKTQPK